MCKIVIDQYSVKYFTKTKNCLNSTRLMNLIYISIYIIIGGTERNSNYNSKLEFQFCTLCPKLFILKEFYFLIL